MKVLSVEDFGDFSCIGEECPISCCGGAWAIYVDADSVADYRKVEGEFGDRLRAALLEQDGKTRFELNAKGDCIFLDEKGLCDIYKHLGPERMCLVCKTYPRDYYQVGDILFRYMTNSCPEITRRVLQRKAPLEVVIGDTNEISEEKGTDWIQFNYAIRAYTAGMDLLQNRALWVQERIALLLVFTKQFQDLMKLKKDPTGLIQAFSNPQVYASLLSEIPIYERDYRVKIKNFVIVFQALFSNAYDHPMWKNCNELAKSIASGREIDFELLAEAIAKGDSEEIQVEMEQIMAYRFFGAFMKGFEKTDYYERMVYEVILYAALLGYIAFAEVELGHACTQEERILFYSLCSRTDHSMGNKNKLEEEIRKEGLDRMENLFRLIS